VKKGHHDSSDTTQKARSATAILLLPRFHSRQQSKSPGVIRNLHLAA
jgi:hypothetical protein